MFKWCSRCVFPFSLALHPLPHLLWLWHARTFSVPFFPQSYVTINLPLGTWWPLAPLRIWGTLCAIPACLAFSPTYKTGICILIPLWPLSETVSLFCLSDSRLLFGREISEQTSSGSCYFEAISQLVFSCVLLSTQLRLFACAHMRACVSVWAQKGEKQRSILKTSGSISAHFVQGPWETGLTAWVRRNHWQVLFDAATVCLCTCLFFNGPLTPHKANLAWDTWKHKGTIFLKLKTCLCFLRKTYPEQTQFPIFSKNLI